jgi:hypothetical protein
MGLQNTNARSDTVGQRYDCRDNTAMRCVSIGLLIDDAVVFVKRWQAGP